MRFGFWENDCFAQYQGSSACLGNTKPEPENSGRENYEKLFHISMNIWY
jgi:hypothetical protein